MHAAWTLPEGDTNFSQRWRAIKMAFSKAIDPAERLCTSRKVRGERGIWQRRFWEHSIRDERDFAAHVDYIHFNPVKHGLAPSASAWPYSSFHRAVARGEYPISWAEEDIDDRSKGEATWRGMGMERGMEAVSRFGLHERGAMPKRIAPYVWGFTVPARAWIWLRAET